MHALRIHPGYLAALCAFAVDGLYLALIAQQGNGGGSRVAFVAASVAAAGIAAAAAEGSTAVAEGLAAAWATATLWIWVVLGALSIGILIVPAGIFATIALTRRRAHPLVIAAGIAVALLIAAAGLAWTPA
jgi:drug/metabolite transporter (DMT)-like permease